MLRIGPYTRKEAWLAGLVESYGGTLRIYVFEREIESEHPGREDYCFSWEEQVGDNIVHLSRMLFREETRYPEIMEHIADLESKNFQRVVAEERAA